MTAGPRVVPDALVPLPLFPDRMARVIQMERHSARCVKADGCSLAGEPMVLVEKVSDAQRGWFHLSQIDFAIAEMQLNGWDGAA